MNGFQLLDVVFYTNPVQWLKTCKYMSYQKQKKSSKESLSIIEEEKILIKSAEIAAAKAKKISSVLGISYKIIKDGELLEIQPDNTVKVIKSITKPNIDSTGLKKGTILTRK
jgi:uncharacterized protein YfeS